MSPLYATPPHSLSSELSSPVQLPLNVIENNVGNGIGTGAGARHTIEANSTTNGGDIVNPQKSTQPDNHFARDTHMRIILGNLKENQTTSSR